MRTRLVVMLVLLGGSLTISGPVSAHHNSKAMYEQNYIMLMGTITEYEWANPHSIISFAVKTDSGAVEQWHAEFLPPSEMTRAGWTKTTIKVGDQVTLRGRPGRNGQRIMWLQSVVMADGRELGRTPQHS